jgi:uncharacterized glyoxalase superfamily protein PhnB
MHADVEEPGRTIVPTLRYRDVAAAIEWLCGAFGFERHLVVPGEDGAVRYAELIFGDGMIMLGPVEESTFGGLMTQPADAGGAETQICYLFVADAAAHCARAKAAGADIVLDIEEEDGGARGYSCRDPEGHIWNFGTYDPWKRRLRRAESAHQRELHPRSGLRQAVVATALLIAMAALALTAWGLGAAHWTPFESEAAAATDTGVDAPARAVQEQLARAREGREAAERATRDAREQLAKERSTREAAERTAKEAREQLGKTGVERTAGELRELREQLLNEKSALATARRIAEETREQLALAERANEAMQEQLAAERAVREEAERVIRQAQEQLAKEQNAKEEAERKQARDKAAKERAAKEAEQAEEARERQRNAKRPPPRPQAAAPSSGITPFTIWPR